MKKITPLLVLLLFLGTAYGQEKVHKLYNPQEDARKAVEKALKKAQKSNKHVLLQIGGNWCPWCIRLHKFCNNNEKVDSTLKANYVFVPVNYSKENKNKALLKELGMPHRFGFPVLVILNEDGKRLHTQNTAFLEEGKGYSKKRVLDVLKNWTPAALNPDNYDL